MYFLEHFDNTSFDYINLLLFILSIISKAEIYYLTIR